MSEQRETPEALFDDPAESVEHAIGLALESEQALPLAVITDEELYAYCNSPEEAAPEGAYFRTLSKEQRQVASVTAMRVLAAQGWLGNEVDEDGTGPFELPTTTVAALEMRKLSPQLSLQIRGHIGEAWYVLRHVRDDLFLRETVTPHGFHAHTLVRLDAAERDVFVAQHQLPAGSDGAAPPHVDRTVSLPQVEGASIGTTSTMSFLEDTILIGTLVRVPEGDGPTTTIINIQPDGAVILGDLNGESVRYRGGTVGDVEEIWDSWVPRMHATLREVDGEAADARV